jgi:predicted secreted protein
VALLANCLLNQNAKVCEGARYPGVANPVVEALLSRGYQLQQLPCPELAFAGARRWWAVYEQYDTPAYRAHCRRLAQGIAPLIEQYLRRGDELILIGLDGSPSTGVRFTSSQPNRPEDDWNIVAGSGVWIQELQAELARRGLPPVPATGWALDMGRFDEAGSRQDLEQFLDGQGTPASPAADGSTAR